MISEEQIKHYKTLIKKGYPAGEVKNQMKQEGFTEADIEIVFKPKVIDMRSWYITSSIIILTFGVLQNAVLLMLLGAVLFGAYLNEQKKFSKD